MLQELNACQGSHFFMNNTFTCFLQLFVITSLNLCLFTNSNFSIISTHYFLELMEINLTNKTLKQKFGVSTILFWK